MDKYTLQEQAYKNGYANGFAAGAERHKSEWIYADGFAAGAERHKSEWIYADNSEIVCKGCGTRMAKFYGDGCAVPRSEQNFCHYCGCSMTFNLK